MGILVVCFGYKLDVFFLLWLLGFGGSLLSSGHRKRLSPLLSIISQDRRGEGSPHRAQPLVSPSPLHAHPRVTDRPAWVSYSQRGHPQRRGVSRRVTHGESSCTLSVLGHRSALVRAWHRGRSVCPVRRPHSPGEDRTDVASAWPRIQGHPGAQTQSGP